MPDSTPPNPTGLALLKQALDLPTQVLDLGCGLVRDLVGEPVKVAGSMLSDQFYWWQWRNRIRLAHRAAEIMDEDGVARRIVPPSFLLPLLEAAGNVDDPDLQEMWARLLASGVAADDNQHPRWRLLLVQMSSDDARTFRAACAATDARGFEFIPPGKRAYWGRSAESPSIARLLSLDLVAQAGRTRVAAQPDLSGVSDEAVDPDVLLSEVGAQFRRAVMPRHCDRSSAAPEAASGST